jgi:hypothetical protein
MAETFWAPRPTTGPKRPNPDPDDAKSHNEYPVRRLIVIFYYLPKYYCTLSFEI